MTFTETPLKGAWLIDIEPIADERGFFASAWAHDDYVRRGLDPTVVQCNIAWNRTRGTIRGIHFQKPPFDEVKIVRCTRGAILDVIVDMRTESPTFGQWTSTELTDANRRMLYIPKGFAHGYQTLTDDAETYYHVSAPYSAAHASGIRWNDRRLGIAWPLPVTVLSPRDNEWPDFG